ncbi:uncharacterized protein LOC136030629 [Artemia franciscana]|uniref:uncharacterized protein LOC136030629 n=1 Tax=Artemia franciscana TaxID=6661 RepID=UPI0032DB5312
MAVVDPVVYDAAVITLDRLTSVRPICIPLYGSNVEGNVGIISGWGEYDEGKPIPSENLRAATVPILSQTHIEEWLPLPLHSELEDLKSSFPRDLIIFTYGSQKGTCGGYCYEAKNEHQRRDIPDNNIDSEVVENVDQKPSPMSTAVTYLKGVSLGLYEATTAVTPITMQCMSSEERPKY